MFTKLDYRMYNYRKLTTLLTMSLIRYYLFKSPYISDYNSELLHQTNLKESIITITVFNSVLVLLETTMLCLIFSVIAEIMHEYKNSNNLIKYESVFNTSCKYDECYKDRLDLSNPFLYSAKCSALRE